MNERVAEVSIGSRPLTKASYTPEAIAAAFIGMRVQLNDSPRPLMSTVLLASITISSQLPTD